MVLSDYNPKDPKGSRLNWTIPRLANAVKYDHISVNKASQKCDPADLEFHPDRFSDHNLPHSLILNKFSLFTHFETKQKNK